VQVQTLAPGQRLFPVQLRAPGQRLFPVQLRAPGRRQQLTQAAWLA